MVRSKRQYIGLSILSLLLGLSAVALEAVPFDFSGKRWVLSSVILAVPALYFTEVLLRWKNSPHKLLFLRRNSFDLLMLGAVVLASLYADYLYLFRNVRLYELAPLSLIVLRSLYFITGQFLRGDRFSVYLGEFSLHPAQVILLSFLAVIITGSVLLMLPFSASEAGSIRPLDALFTATSAVCVTGLVTIDTSTAFSVWGQAAILVLIQIGGLGIMIISYFVLFNFRRSVGVGHKLLVSYMVNENDMTRLRRTLSRIMGITFCIEGFGVLAFLPAFSGRFGFTGKAVFFAVFHAVSAFCNAGFSLFSDSLESFKSDPSVMFPATVLIIAGGLSFPVVSNLIDGLRSFVGNRFGKSGERFGGFPANAKVVLWGTFLLLLSGTLLTYAFEYRNTLGDLPIGLQYLNAFFQSATYRTAGFNSIPFGALSDAMYAVVIVFMFVGGASGSTAGGIKINTAGVLIGFLRSAFNNSDKVTMFRHTVNPDIVSKSFVILVFAVASVFAGATVLSFTENIPFIRLLFEATSAFGTVGLSAGVTPLLSAAGKLVIICIMFIGRVGPLTLVAAVAVRKERNIEYPRATLYIG